MSAAVIKVHPTHPQRRLIKLMATVIQADKVIAYPTDSCYALGCRLGSKGAQARIRAVRQLDTKHNFTLICRDLSALGAYARVDNQAYRFIRALTPGPYTFVLRASREVPRRLQNPRRRTIGLRVPQHAVVAALLDELGEPLMSTTLQLPGDEAPLADAGAIQTRLSQQIDLIVDGGPSGVDATTVVDLSGDRPVIIRAGRGPIDNVIELETA